MKETFLNHLIFKLPEVTFDNYFTYDSVCMIMMFISLIAGLMICFMGYKFILSLFLTLIGCISGIISMSIMENRIDIPVLKMFLMVMCIFLTIILFYEIYWGYIRFLKNKNSNSGLERIHSLEREKHPTDSPLRDFLVMTSPLSGAVVFSSFIYIFIFREIKTCILLTVILSVLGYIYQKKRKVFQREFYTYDDIYFGR